MKQLALLLTVLISFTLIAQEGTTLEEYRYLSKGYVYQLEMGLDARKEGYLIKNVFASSEGANLVGLYPIGNGKPSALLIILDNGKAKANYICLPNGEADERVKSLAESDQSSLSSDVKMKYQRALNEFLFAALSNPELKALAYSPMVTPDNYQEDQKLVSRSAKLEQFVYKTPKPKEVKIESAPQEVNKKSPTTSIHGDIDTRTILSSETIYVNTRKKGVVAIKVCVDKDGKVTSAKYTQRGSTTFDAYLKKVALNATKKLTFVNSAVAEECGIVNYKF